MENYKKTDLLNWEAGKVNGFLGKNLIDLSNGSFKMVKVEPFAAYPTHLHPDKTEFIYVLEGNPIITIGENEYDGEKGAFFTLPNAMEHKIANPADKECLLLVGAIKV